MISYILAILTSAVFLAGDFISKKYILVNFSERPPVSFIKGVVGINFTQNDGAAWGFLSGHTVLLVIITITVMAFCIIFLWKNAKKSKLLFWAVCLVLSGGLGNMYDRIFRDGKVVDFLQFEFWTEFPVFNVADCSIVIGAGLLILYYVIDIMKEYKLKKQDNDASN